jgi:hypothetical protein
MAFKASPAKKGLFNIHGIEEFVEKFIERKLKEARVEERITELRKALRLDKKSEQKPATSSLPKVTAPNVPSPRFVEPKAPPSPEIELKPAARPAKAAKKPAKVKAKAPGKTAAPTNGGPDPLELLLKAFEAHPKKASLAKAGKQKDQLLRSLIPLYVGQKLDVEVSSGVTSKFWSTQGITYAAPNAAKALREHSGFAKRTDKGVQITPAGVKYVDDALKA